MTEPIARIEAALARLGAEHEPPPGWEARVLAAAVARKRRAWWWIPVPVVALAVAGLLLYAIGPWRGARFELAFAHERGSHDAFRGSTKDDPAVMVGDTVHAGARHGAAFRAVWVYVNSRLVAACPRDPACRVTGDATVIDFEVRTVGRHVVVALHSRAPIPPASGAYDADVAGAEGAGAELAVKTFDVR